MFQIALYGLEWEIVTAVPAHSSTVSTIHQENWSQSSGHSQMGRLPDQNHYGLHELQQQHARLHKEIRQREEWTVTEAKSDLMPVDSNVPNSLSKNNQHVEISDPQLWPLFKDRQKPKKFSAKQN